MKVNIVKSLWGMVEGDSLEDKLSLIRDAGYSGVECEPPDMAPEAWRKLCEQYGLVYIAAIYSLTVDEFAENAKRASSYGPHVINAQTGRDYLDFDAGCRYFERALEVEQRIGVRIAHETHRHRMFFTPWTTARYLDRFPELSICADISHWVLVTESRLADMTEHLEKAFRRAIHVHARIGHEEAPQVPDPRAPRYAEYVDLYESWWRRIFESKARSGAATMTVTPEYGPPNYMPIQPESGEPVANLWDVCLWGANRLRAMAIEPGAANG